MTSSQASQPPGNTAAFRLAALSRLDAGEIHALEEAAAYPQRVMAHREIVTEGWPVPEPTIIMSGWACRVRNFSDGRRQILSFLLPGDLLGMCHQRQPLASTTITALTETRLCRAPAARDGRRGTGLAEAYAVSGALEEYYLFRQIARLGRLNAYERLVDWMLEVRERLILAGLGSENSFPMPLTQELLADALGLTSVHVNRTLQTMRREGLIDLRGGALRLLDSQRLAQMVDFHPARVTELVGGVAKE
jgi:CRP-like cAMP-binding protein